MAEAEACIEWYESQKLKTKEYLDSLKQLQELEEQQRQPEVTHSEKD